MEGVGDVAHKISDQDALLLKPVIPGIEASLNFSVVFEDDDERIFDFHARPSKRLSRRQLLGAFRCPHHGLD